MTPDSTAVPLCAPCQIVPISMHLLPSCQALSAQVLAGPPACRSSSLHWGPALFCLELSHLPHSCRAPGQNQQLPPCALQEDQEEAAALCLDWLHEHSAVIKEQPGGSCIPVHRAYSALPITALPCVHVHVHAWPAVLVRLGLPNICLCPQASPLCPLNVFVHCSAPCWALPHALCQSLHRWWGGSAAPLSGGA